MIYRLVSPEISPDQIDAELNSPRVIKRCYSRTPIRCYDAMEVNGVIIQGGLPILTNLDLLFPVDSPDVRILERPNFPPKSLRVFSLYSSDSATIASHYQITCNMFSIYN